MKNLLHHSHALHTGATIVEAQGASPPPHLPPFPPQTVHHLLVAGVLRDQVRALVAVDMHQGGPFPMAIAPHDGLMLSVQLGRGEGAAFARAEAGHNTRLTGIRQHTGRFVGAGCCTTLFALLTPLGVVQLLDSQPLQAQPRIRATLAHWLDGLALRELEHSVAAAPALADKLQRLAHWLEGRASMRRTHTRAAVRAAAAAMRICAEPRVAMDTLAAEQHVSRRQLERDFTRWLGTSPRHLAQVARLQAVSRQAHAGAALADIAAGEGFADQAHMSRVVRQLAGLTPRQFVARARSPLAAAFRAATEGSTVYL